MIYLDTRIDIIKLGTRLDTALGWPRPRASADTWHTSISGSGENQIAK